MEKTPILKIADAPLVINLIETEENFLEEATNRLTSSIHLANCL
jgi:hypothetical protein